MNNEVLNLDNDEVFGNFKRGFEIVLKNTIQKMIDKENDSAEIKATVKIDLVKEWLDDGSNGGDGRMITRPDFKHKIGSVVQDKEETAGKFSSGKMEMVWDDETKAFVTREIKSNQVSFYDDETEEDAEPLRLEAAAETQSQIEASSEEDTENVIDADFREIDSYDYDEPSENMEE